MAVPDEEGFITYDCDGATNTFPITFTYLKDEYLLVRHYDDITKLTEDLLLGSEYTIVSNDVVTTLTYPVNDKIYLELNVPVSQAEVLFENGQISSDLLNYIHDKLTLLSRQNSTLTSSSLRLETPESGAVLTLPDATRRAGHLIEFDASGDASIVRAVDTELVTISAAMTPVVEAVTLGEAKTEMDITEVPDGGTTNQVLTKLSATDGDVGWKSGVVSATSGNSFPTSPMFAEEYYRTDLDEWYKYNGSVWTQI